jgi:hypothetical protein
MSSFSHTENEAVPVVRNNRVFQALVVEARFTEPLEMGDRARQVVRAVHQFADAVCADEPPIREETDRFFGEFLAPRSGAVARQIPTNSAYRAKTPY